MNSEYIIILLIVVVIFALVNTFLMYHQYAVYRESKHVLDSLPENVTYSTYTILYKNGDTIKDVLEGYFDSLKDSRCVIVERSLGKPLHLHKGMKYLVDEKLAVPEK